jgi:hypothetical protein
MPERLDEKEFADWRAAVYQLAADTGRITAPGRAGRNRRASCS